MLTAIFINFSNILATSFIGLANRSTRRKLLTCHKLPTTFITPHHWWEWNSILGIFVDYKLYSYLVDIMLKEKTGLCISDI
jgi:hypothetical protein